MCIMYFLDKSKELKLDVIALTWRLPIANQIRCIVDRLKISKNLTYEAWGKQLLIR